MTLIFGIAYTIVLPLIGIFDENTRLLGHYICAIIMFFCFLIYATLLATALHKYRYKFPPEEQRTIDIMYNSIVLLMTLFFCFAIGHQFYGDRGIVALFEWATILVFINFFSLASFDNPFYDSIH